MYYGSRPLYRLAFLIYLSRSKFFPSIALASFCFHYLLSHQEHLCIFTVIHAFNVRIFSVSSNIACSFSLTLPTTIFDSFLSSPFILVNVTLTYLWTTFLERLYDMIWVLSFDQLLLWAISL